MKTKKGTDSGNVSVKYPVASVCLITAGCEAPGQKELNECFIKVKTKTCRQCFIKKHFCSHIALKVYECVCVCVCVFKSLTMLKKLHHVPAWVRRSNYQSLIMIIWNL